MTDSTYNDLTVVIPTLNESRNIGLLLETLRAKYGSAHLVVVDDGSTDGTPHIVQKLGEHDPHIKLLDRSAEETKGLTASVLEGILAASTKYFVVMDGDFQHPPETIMDMYAQLYNHDLVIAERSKVVTKWLLHRKCISWLATLLGNARLAFKGFGWHDVMSGYFGGNTSQVKLLIEKNPTAFYLRGYKILFDLLKLMPAQTDIGVVKYIFGVRKGGTSKIGWQHIQIYMKSLLR